MKTYTEFCQRKLAPDFTGVLYSDSGRSNYTVAYKGEILRSKRLMNRWFKTAEAAERALAKKTETKC